MLRLTLEIVPGGCELAKRTIGVMEIANVTDNFELADEYGDYEFNFTTEDIRVEDRFGKWPRKLGPWKLVQACLQLCHGMIPIDHSTREYNHGGIRKRKRKGFS